MTRSGGPAHGCWGLIPFVLAAWLCVQGGEPLAQAPSGLLPRVTLTPAFAATLAGSVDANSPALWDLKDGERRLFVITSYAGVPSVASGVSLTRLGTAQAVRIDPHPGHGVWLEAVVSDGVGTWYGYYHNEIPADTCGRLDRSVVRIGAARSHDQGLTWENLGIILEALPDSFACGSPNRYVIGGVGDLSVMLDADQTDLYLFFSQYPRQAASQGVAVARLRWADRDEPIGRVSVWHDRVWEPARAREIKTADGEVLLEWEYPAGTPLAPPTLAWHDADGRVDAFWGPSVHWNVDLNQYVMLLNRAKDEKYGQEGIYVSFAQSLDDPAAWSPPQRILSGGAWYPQVIGLEPGIGTDKTAGRTARFFMTGRSAWMINFSK